MERYPNTKIINTAIEVMQKNFDKKIIEKILILSFINKRVLMVCIM